MEAILSWILTYLLNYLLGRITAQAASQLNEIVEDKNRDVINEENVKRYEAAQSRADRVRAALDLINSAKP